jgi:CDP-diacylglycerol--serine O-phosphatidyltransferase
MMKELKLKDYATLLGTFCGILAIVMAVGFQAYRGACFMIYLGIAADLLDGFLARKMNQMNALGRELDSLSDGIVFGVAPAIVAFCVFTQPLTQTNMEGHPVWLMLVCSFLFIAGAIIRLAWFNIAEGEGYQGLPTPLSAGFIALCMVADYYAWAINSSAMGFNYFMHYFTPIAMIFMAWLNVTDLVVYGKIIRKKTGGLKFLLVGNGILIAIVAFFGNFYRFEAAAFVFAMLLVFWLQSVIFIGLGFYFAKNQKS